MAFQGGFNAAIEIVRRQQLSAQTDQDLDSMLVSLRLYYASHGVYETKSCIEAIENEQDRRQKQRHHNEAQAELKRLHQAQMVEVKQLFAESNADSDKKHAQTISVAEKANSLSRLAVWIASLGAVIAVFAVVVAHRDSMTPSISGTNATQIKTPVTLPEKPEIVLPKPLPIATNPIPTNAIQKK